MNINNNEQTSKNYVIEAVDSNSGGASQLATSRQWSLAGQESILKLLQYSIVGENAEMFPGGPQFSEKGLINRSIVGKPEVFDKMHNAASNSIKFMKDVNLQSVQQIAKKMKRSTKNIN